MTTPLRTLPARVVRWSRLARWLRAADAVGGFGVTWAAVQAWGPGAGPRLHALLALAAAAGAACVPFVRRRFRPVSGLVALWVSRRLAPGAAAWFIRPGAAARGRPRSLSRMRVATPIGQRTETPIPYGRRSFTRVSESPTTAYLDVL